jgi:hypothetical protein
MAIRSAIELHPKAVIRLDKLKRILERRSDSDIFNLALRVLYDLVFEYDEVCSVAPDGLKTWWWIIL